MGLKAMELLQNGFKKQWSYSRMGLKTMELLQNGFATHFQWEQYH